MKFQKHFLVALTLLIVPIVSVYAQTLTVSGEVEKPLTISLADFEKFPSIEVKGKDNDEKEHTFKGTLLVNILKEAGVTLGSALRGRNLMKYVLVSASDGYHVVFALPELDPEFTAESIIIATTVDGKPLPKDEGPFRIVVPKDKKQARWVRQATGIKVLISK